MPIPPRSKRYISYMLRLWQTHDRGRSIWRVSLESPGTGERQGFSDLAELFEFLQQQISEDDIHTHKAPKHKEQL